LSKLLLTEIWIYPIKSLAGVRVKSGAIKEKGMAGDRRLMLIDDSNQFMTQRQNPMMSQFNVAFDGRTISVSSKKDSALGEIKISTEKASNSVIQATIWDDVVEVTEVDRRHSEWFSEALGTPCKLVLFPEANQRRVDPKYVQENKNVSLADGYPYLIIGTNSLRDLSDRIGTEMPMKRFRPNFVFEGGAPYEEDGWKNFQIGNVQFVGVKPCGRCVLITVDPETGIKGDEPLRTLSTYRKADGKVRFGQNVIMIKEGVVNEGDEIKLL
jgi:uncharacterized protein YcbX